MKSLLGSEMILEGGRDRIMILKGVIQLLPIPLHPEMGIHLKGGGRHPKTMMMA